MLLDLCRGMDLHVSKLSSNDDVQGPVVTIVWSLTFLKAFTSLTAKIFQIERKKHDSFAMKSISRVYRITAWQICNQCLNLLYKILMSVCAQVSKCACGSPVSCKQRKFQQKIHSKWKLRMLNFEKNIYQQIQMILRYDYDIVLFTIYLKSLVLKLWT